MSQVDWLSQLLQMITITGQLEIRCTYGAPWRVAWPQSAAHEIPYHVVLTRHPLLAYKQLPLLELAAYPLVLCDPHMCEGYCRELTRLLRQLEREPNVVERASSLAMMLTLVGAGYGVGFTTPTRMASSQRPDVVARPLAIDSAVITTYLLRLRSDTLRPTLERFIARLHSQVEG